MYRLIALAACAFSIATVTLGEEHDQALQQLITDHRLQPLRTPATDPNKVELGRSLFFDHELSGGRNVSCASCHHPSTSSADSRSLPSGVGGLGVGPDRTQAPDRNVIPRSAPEVFHRGNSEWTSMFWDSRVAIQDGALDTPAKAQLPPDVDDILTAQAMFPVTSRDEMRGRIGDRDASGRLNELAELADDDFQGIWNALTNRLLAIPAYQQAFEQAYPDVPMEQLGFQHAAKAIAEFEKDAFSPSDSAWDRYLGGDESAMSDAAKRGATHFLSGNCASCHSGNLLTNQQHHNLAIPQFGPGKDDSQLDTGRALQTGEAGDEFAFRTPPLRNVALTGPWMHNGAFADLEDVIRHHYDPVDSLAAYDSGQLPEHLRASVKLDETTIEALTASIDPLLPTSQELTEETLYDLMAFMGALTSPSTDLMLHATPESVLSGLDVEISPVGPLEILYDPGDGSLILDSLEEHVIDALFLRIVDDEAGGAAAFEFATGVAPWSVDKDITLSDTIAAQSFLDFRGDPLTLFSTGDTIENLLIEGLMEDDISNHLLAAYRIHGSPVLWNATVAIVPEPAGAATCIAGCVCFLLMRRRD